MSLDLGHCFKQGPYTCIQQTTGIGQLSYQFQSYSHIVRRIKDCLSFIELQLYKCFHDAESILIHLAKKCATIPNIPARTIHSVVQPLNHYFNSCKKSLFQFLQENEGQSRKVWNLGNTVTMGSIPCLYEDLYPYVNVPCPMTLKQYFQYSTI